MPRGQYSQQDPPCDDLHSAQEESFPGAGQKHQKGNRSSLRLLLQVCADKGQGAGELTPNPVHTPLGTRHPHGRGCSPNSDIKPGKGHQDAVTSKHHVPQLCSNAPARLGQASYVALPHCHPGRGPGHLLGTPAFQDSDQFTSLQQKCVNSSKPWAAKTGESHEGPHHMEPTVPDCAQPLRLHGDLTSHF